MRKVVKEWLLEKYIIYDKLVFSKALNEKKNQEVIKNKIDLIIEDSPNNINELSDIIPVICYDTIYNKIVQMIEFLDVIVGMIFIKQ